MMPLRASLISRDWRMANGRRGRKSQTISVVGRHAETRPTFPESSPRSPDEPPQLSRRKSVIRSLHCFFDAKVQGVYGRNQGADRTDRMLAVDSFELVEVLVKILASTDGHVDKRKQPTVREVVNRNHIERGCKASETQAVSDKWMLKSVSGAVIGKLRLVKSKDEKFHQGIKSSFPCSTLLLEGKTGGKPDRCYREERLSPSCPHLWLQAGSVKCQRAIKRIGHVGLHSRLEAEA